ncbi:MAG: transcriptional repressor [Pseudomonadota bacterium]|nr:transcriptional repressor [Pseudomonadota bacterium]
MDPATRIRASGLRITRQRVAVLEAVDTAPHASAASVLKAVSATLPDVSHQAVYDCLADLTAAGQLRRFTIDGGPARYETRTHDNHHHFVCRMCGDLSDVDCAVGAAPCLLITDPGGFVVDEAEIIYRGQCARCAAVDAPVSL